jgi:lipoprotein-anchoring transpeptidase ErfK/SrfK
MNLRVLAPAVMAGVLFRPFLSLAAETPAAVVAPPVPTGTELNIFSPTGGLISSFRPFSAAGDTAQSLTVSDLDKNGASELIVGAGTGNKPLVRTFNLDGTLIHEFLAYAEGMHSGVNVAACDLTGDGLKEIVVGAGAGGGPQVRVFKNDGTFFNVQFFAYDKGFRSGVNVACADVDADGLPDIITGAGPGGGADVKIFDAAGRLKATQTLSMAPVGAGALVFTGNIDNDPEEEILASPAANGTFDLTVIDHSKNGYTGSSRQTWITQPSYGMAAAVSEKMILVATGAYSSAPQIKNLNTGASFSPFPGAPDVAAKISAIPETGNIAALAALNTLPFDPTSQYIKVDISEQRLTAYVNGLEVKSFLVSTAKAGYKTPIGKTSVMAKIPLMNYVWSYGPGNPNNYNLPNVKWNMRIFPHIYIHSAYWHHNFGHPMSHGCVNTSIPDADWIFHWAQVGTPVETVE